MTVLSINKKIADTVNINIYKEWAGEPEGWQGRPDKVVVKLYRDGEKYGDDIILKSSSGWHEELHGLPRFDETGHEYDYSVLENEVAGYRQEISEDGSDFTITNNLEMNKLTVSMSVEGNMGDRARQFEVALYLGEDEESLEEAERFTLAHGDEYVIMIPEGMYYRLSGEATDHQTSYENGEGIMTGDISARIINTRNVPVPTGSDPVDHVGIIAGFFAVLILILDARKKGIKNP